MDKGIINILKSHGCGYMADDYKEMIEEIETFVKEREKAIDVIHCCTELPTKETVNTVARNKALKYAYANEDTYEDYVNAIEEGADYVKNYLTKYE